MGGQMVVTVGQLVVLVAVGMAVLLLGRMVAAVRVTLGVRSMLLIILRENRRF